MHNLVFMCISVHKNVSITDQYTKFSIELTTTMSLWRSCLITYKLNYLLLIDAHFAVCAKAIGDAKHAHLHAQMVKLLLLEKLKSKELDMFRMPKKGLTFSSLGRL